MLGGDWSKRDQTLAALFCAAALFGAVIIAYGTGNTLGANRERQQQAPYYTDRQAKARVAESCRTRAENDIIECAFEETKAYAETRHADQDLQAQESMALWATVVGIVGFLQLAISGLGLIALLQTIRQGRLGLERAHEANVIAERSSERQLRAYVNVSQVKMTGFQHGQKPRLEAELFNGGQTPGRGCTVQTFYHYTEEDPDTVKMPLWGAERRSLMDVLPGKPSYAGVLFEQPIGTEVFLKILSGKGTIVFAGYIAYRDIFRKRHLTLFRYFVIPELIADDGAASLVASCRQNRSS